MGEMDEMTDMTEKRTHKRRRKLIRLDVQLKVVFVTLFIACLVLLLNFQLTLAGLWSLSNEYADAPRLAAVVDVITSKSIEKFLISVGMAIPLAASVGILYSFKFCGPIYRFKRYFQELVTGRWDERCMLRRSDDLHDVCDSINEAVDAMRNHIRHGQDVAEEMRSFLDAALARGDASEGARELRGRVASLLAVGKERFGERNDSPADGAESAGQKTTESQLESQS